MPRSGALLAAALLPACVVVTDEREPATPQRPTVSSDTSTTAPGTLELEAGVSIDPGDFLDTPLVLKHGLSERTELFAGFSPYRWVDRPGSDGSGIGDVVIGSRHRLVDQGPAPASFALLMSAKLPTADEDEGLGTGEVDASLAGIVNQRRGDLTWNGYWEMIWAGDPDGSGADLRHALSLAGSVPAGPGLTAFGELAALAGAGPDMQFLTAGVAYAPQASLVFDVGLLVGLDRDAPDAVILVGVTTNLGRVRPVPPPAH